MTTSPFPQRYGPWAVIAGASEGLGAEFALQIAQHGVNVLALARRQAALDQVATEIRARCSVEVRTCALDLGSSNLEAELRACTAGLDVGLLVYNAAYSPIGNFFDVSLEDKLQMLNVNCRGPLVLSHVLGAAMVERKRGGIVLVSSMASLQGSGMVATYAATKAFDTVLAEGLWNELTRKGVDVLACVAGATETPGYVRSKPNTPRSKYPWGATREAMPPSAVARETLARLRHGPRLFPGRANRMAAFLMTRILPKRSAIDLMGRATRRMYKH